jgi:hypothetical protein
MLPVAADYPFLDILFTMLFFFAFVVWIWMLFTIFGDVFRRHDIGGWAKAGWVVLMIVLPFLGALIYLGTQSAGMTERRNAQVASAQAEFDDYVRQAAGGGGGAAAEIAQAKKLLESGDITQPEFDELKRKALS